MPDAHNLYLFFIASLLLNLTPGNDMMYVASRSLSQGVRAGMISALGVFVGCFVHILAELSHDRARPGQVVVGFAAETGDDSGSVLELGRAKLERKGCDLLVVNDVRGGAVFGADHNQAVIIGADGSRRDVPRGTKTALAHALWDEVAARLERPGPD